MSAAEVKSVVKRDRRPQLKTWVFAIFVEFSKVLKVQACLCIHDFVPLISRPIAASIRH
jgi:hypothetical protein